MLDVAGHNYVCLSVGAQDAVSSHDVTFLKCTANAHSLMKVQNLVVMYFLRLTLLCLPS